MKRKISILFLAFLFFAANIGLSFSLHLCKMMDEPIAEYCGMCTMPNMQDDVMTMECSVDENNSNESISGYVPVCCEIEVVENKISDQFLFVNNKTNGNTQFTVILISANIGLESNPLQHSELDLHNTSPPHLDNNIYLQNSILLI